MMKPTQEQKKNPRGLFLNGEWISGYGKPLISRDPFTNDPVFETTSASKSDVTRAVKAAKLALPAWARLPLGEREAFLLRYKETLKQFSSDITLAISKETGKPLSESKSEVGAMIAKIDISIDAYHERCKERRIEMEEALSLCRFKPYGTLALLGPFNFPGHLPNGHLVPALLAGNTILFKPSEHTPLVGELIVRCLESAGLPKGVVALLQGGPEIGKALTSEEVDGILFTGSYAVGKALLKANAEEPGRILALEMGGNNPLVVSKPKGIDLAVQQTIDSAFLTAGQRCTSARRLIVVESKEGEAFVEALLKKMETLTIGHYTDTPEPFMGPLINEAAAIHALTTQAALIAKGATPLFPMRHLLSGTGRVTPGLLDVTTIKELPDDELFAPLLKLIWVDTFQEAVAVANKTRYGLSAGLLSPEREEWEQFLFQVKAGIINWNRPLIGASSKQPFGGIGRSGNLRPSAFFAADYSAYPVASLVAHPTCQ